MIKWSRALPYRDSQPAPGDNAGPLDLSQDIYPIKSPRYIQSSGWRHRRIHWIRVHHVAATLLLISLYSPIAVAKSIYRIDGIVAPQVNEDQLAASLNEQLVKLREQIDARAQRVTLSQALESGLLNNPQLATAYAQIQREQWNLVAIRRQWYPTLSADSNRYVLGREVSTTTIESRNLDALSETSDTKSTNTAASISLNWTFFDPTRAPFINAAEEAVKRQQLLFNVSARNLVLEIQQSYFKVQEEELLIKAFEEILETTSRQVRLTEAQFNNGLVSIADVEQIRTQQYSTLGTLINAYRQFIDAAARLSQAMALTPGSLALPSEELSPMGVWEESLEATIRQALALREEIRASLAAADSSSWRATALFNRYWPKFSMQSNTSFQGRYQTQGMQGDNRRWDASLGISFNWMLFDGGIAAAEAESQRADESQFKDEASEKRLIVSREVEQSYANYLTSQLAVQSTKAQSQSARQAASAVQERFAVGVTSMADLVQTLEQAIRAANNYATAILGYNSAVADLYRSSARWPEGTEPLLKQRALSLRER